MALRSDWSEWTCPAARGINLIGDPWVLLILRELFWGVQRFDALREATGAADNVLSRRLTMMVDSGLITRVPYEDGGRARSDYFLTEAGADALPVLHAFAIWGEKHAPRSDGSPALHIFCQSCGEESTTGESCSACGQLLTMESTAWLRPRSRRTEPKALGKANRTAG